MTGHKVPFSPSFGFILPAESQTQHMCKLGSEALCLRGWAGLPALGEQVCPNSGFDIRGRCWHESK